MGNLDFSWSWWSKDDRSIPSFRFRYLAANDHLFLICICITWNWKIIWLHNQRIKDIHQLSLSSITIHHHHQQHLQYLLHETLLRKITEIQSLLKKMLAIFRYLLSSAVMSHPHLHRRPSPPARPACLSAAALSARFRANFSARILPLGSTLAWRYTLFLEIWFVSWLTVSFLLAAAISQRIPPRCAAKKRLACPFFRTNSPLLTLILFEGNHLGDHG